jgi:hypothetical protein
MIELGFHVSKAYEGGSIDAVLALPYWFRRASWPDENWFTLYFADALLLRSLPSND